MKWVRAEIEQEKEEEEEYRERELGKMAIKDLKRFDGAPRDQLPSCFLR
ncbi:hypothetical protein T4D_9468 [Trichinella pseudospiralis]|uniref:Uncharacterized protein n=1 Tax=Trichinella pseudospiralis TaxID=6337 RepID=A0A0V1FIQ6_TRIPS|nr:hypothetical protein T4D_9468 [Trichinella pseudospiralis]